MEPKQTSSPPAQTGIGFLIIRVSTALGAIPLEGARVDVRTYPPEGISAPEYRSDVISSMLSGRDGNTPRLSLPTQPRENSTSPGNPFPYSRYQIEVTLSGYRSQSYIGLPIYDGVTSIQTAVMIPLPEDGIELPSVEDEVFENSPNDL